ncbi:MAG: hypothetical protein OXF47_00545 [Nitrospira sp.]|nr:hypothetical protein [Nitrospira sp.]
MRGYLTGLAKAGLFLMFFVMVAGLLSSLVERPQEPKPKTQNPAQVKQGPTQEERRLQWEKEEAFRREQDNLSAELALLTIDQCATRLEFIDQGIFRKDWWITCPTCSAVPVDQVYLPAFLDVLDEWAVGREMTVTDFLERYGQC